MSATTTVSSHRTSGLASAPATRTRFSSANKHPRITVTTRPSSLRLSECVINEEAQEGDEEGVQYATVRNSPPDNTPSKSFALKPANQLPHPPATANALIGNRENEKAERRKLIRSALSIGNHGGGNELALRAARRRVQNRTQSMYLPSGSQNPFGLDPNESARTPPASPPVFNFSGQKSPLSAISPNPANGGDSFPFSSLPQQLSNIGNGLPAQVLAQHKQSLQRATSGPVAQTPTQTQPKGEAAPQRQRPGHRRAQSNDEKSSAAGGGTTSNPTVPPIPSLDQIREWAAAKKDLAGGPTIGPVVEITKPVEDESNIQNQQGAPSQRDGFDEESDKEKEKDERKSKRASLVILKRRSMGASPPEQPAESKPPVITAAPPKASTTTPPAITFSASTPPSSANSKRNSFPAALGSARLTPEKSSGVPSTRRSFTAALPSPRTFSTGRSVSESTRSLVAKNMINRLSSHRMPIPA